MNDNVTNRHGFRRLWHQSSTSRVVDLWRNWANAAWIGLIGGLRFGIDWHGLIEGMVILGVVFMPVLVGWECLIPLLLLLWITGPAKNKRVSARQGAAAGAGWGFLWSVLAVSSFLGPGFTAGLAVLARFGSWFIMAWLIGRTFTLEMSKRIIKYLVYTSLIWLTIGFWQLWSGAPTPQGWLGSMQAAVIPVRIYSVYGNPNVFALYLLSILVLSHDLSRQCTAKIERYCLIGIFLLVVAALYFTYTRMAWLIAAFCLIIRYSRNQWRPGLLVIGLTALLLLLLPDFNIRLSSLTNLHDSSIGYRIQIWRGVWNALRDFWLWGAGPGSFQRIYPHYQIGRSVSQHAHQFYLQFWLEFGIFGLLALITVLKRVLTGYCSTGAHPTVKTLTVILMIFLIYGFSETWYIHRFNGGFFWFINGLLQSFDAQV